MMSSGVLEFPLQTLALVKRNDITSYELEKMELRQPEDDEVIIRVGAVSLCGSDITLYKWNDLAKTIAKLPFVPGHECTGTVVYAGKKAFVASSTNDWKTSTELLQVGQRVAVENHYYCGQCVLCAEDRGDICLDMGQFGHGKKTDQGGCSEYAIVPARFCFPITLNISVDEAVLLEPLGVAHNAIEQLQVNGQQVLVLGCGPIGLLACSVAKALGAERVIAADINRDRLELAKRMKADVIVNTLTDNLSQVVSQETNGVGVSRILEATGSDHVISGMFSLLRKGGHVTMVGLPKTLHVENAAHNIVFKSLTLRSVHGRRIFHTWRQCQHLIADGLVDISPIVSHRLPLSRYTEAFDALLDGKACKIILHPNEAIDEQMQN